MLDGSVCIRHGGMGDSGIRDKTGEGLDGSGDGIRAGARGMGTEKGRGVGIKWEMA